MERTTDRAIIGEKQACQRSAVTPLRRNVFRHTTQSQMNINNMADSIPLTEWRRVETTRDTVHPTVPVQLLYSVTTPQNSVTTQTIFSSIVLWSVVMLLRTIYVNFFIWRYTIHIFLWFINISTKSWYHVVSIYIDYLSHNIRLLYKSRLKKINDTISTSPYK